MIFLDSSVLISFFWEQEERHARAVELIEFIEREQGVITDHVLDEVVTFLSRRIGGGRASSAGRVLLDSTQIDLAFVCEDDVRSALERVKSNFKFSLCDGLSVEAMKRRGITRIISFDSDFDAIKGIQRIS